MANLQVKGLDEGFYEDLKRLAVEENRSLSQQVVVMLREYLAKRDAVRRAATPAEVLLQLAGSWEDERSAEEIVRDIRGARRNSGRFRQGL